MKKIVFLLVCPFLALTNLAWTAPLNQAHIPANAKWLIHLDVDALSHTELWRLLNLGIDEKLQKKIDSFKNRLGSDLTRDFSGATLYGTDAKEENAVFMVYGWFDKEKLLALLVANEAYAASTYKGQKFHHWWDRENNTNKVGMFAADDMIVISQSEKALAVQVDLLREEATSLAGKKDTPLASLVDTPQNAFLLIAANDLAELGQSTNQVALLKNARMMVALVGENNGNINLSVDLTAQSAEAAMQIENVLNGIKSFVELKHAEQPEILALLQAVNLIQNEDQLLLNAEYPSAKLFEMYKNHKNKKASVEQNL